MPEGSESGNGASAISLSPNTAALELLPPHDSTFTYRLSSRRYYLFAGTESPKRQGGSFTRLEVGCYGVFPLRATTAPLAVTCPEGPIFLPQSPVGERLEPE